MVNIKQTLSKTLLAILGVVISATVFVAIITISPSKLKANQLEVNVPTGCATATATTTRNVLTFGSGTTTVTCDIPASTNGAVQNFNSMGFFLQFTATSTLSELNVRQEFSFNSGVDWYRGTAPVLSTTTPQIRNAGPGEFQITFASTSFDGGIVKGNNNRALYYVPFTPPAGADSVRFLISVPHSDSTNSMIWAQISGTNERAE